jgi:putative ABC transport system permease protein
MDRLLSDAIASSAFRSRLLAAFALIALMLAVIGLYGILAYTVTQRTREFGVRFALGARGGEVVRLVVAHGMRLVVVGLAFGMLGAIAASRLLRSQLEGVNTTDPTVFLAVITLLAGAGLAACVVPARRATRISPITALRDG